MKLEQFIKETTASIYIGSESTRTTEDVIYTEFDIAVAPLSDGIHVLEEHHSVTNPSRIKFKLVIK